MVQGCFAAYQSNYPTLTTRRVGGQHLRPGPYQQRSDSQLQATPQVIWALAAWNHPSHALPDDAVNNPEQVSPVLSPICSFIQHIAAVHWLKGRRADKRGEELVAHWSRRRCTRSRARRLSEANSAVTTP